MLPKGACYHVIIANDNLIIIPFTCFQFINKRYIVILLHDTFEMLAWKIDA
jgi:hypothetical protein